MASLPGVVIAVNEDSSPDSFDAQSEASDLGSSASSLTSIDTDILLGELGEGRQTYAVYGKKEYGFPMDTQELERLDICHIKYFALLDKKHFLSPIDEEYNPQRILDLGCGTGTWCIDVADMFPSALVVGVDKAATQPNFVPPNCTFEIDDIEEEWTWQEGTADFIFARDLILSIRDFPRLIEQSYKHLKPGGWAEFHCVTGVLHCDDGSVPNGSALQQFSSMLRDSCIKYGTPVDDPTRWRQQFQDAGFDAVAEEVLKLPCGPWAADARLRLLGGWEQRNLLDNLEGMVMRLFQKALGQSEAEITVYLSQLRKDIRSRDMHAYWPFYTVRGRKPLTDE
ncbi:SAM domain [Cordyceps militaris]|uniref:SAM domain n=1 Tax=Cordyceps militaris TaxID=73501 RepID=A0A2H4SSA9_CORMI|nr:SAM domain [Cordyceps militaris]